MGVMVNLQASIIAFISHERKQVVNQYLYLHFPTQSMKNVSFNLVFAKSFHKLHYRLCKSYVWNGHQTIHRCYV